MKTVTAAQNKEIIEETEQYRRWIVKNTTFSEALTEMILDHKTHCKRVGWNYEVFRLHQEEYDLIQHHPYFVAVINDEYEVWCPSNNDLFANDWQISGITHIPITDVVI